MQQTFVLSNDFLLGFLPAVVLLSALAIIPYRRYLEISFLRACGVWLVSAVAGICFFISRFISIQKMGNIPFLDKETIIYSAVFGGVMFLFLIPLIIKLYRKWIGGDLTENEKLASVDGVRAWLTVGNLICCGGISFCCWWAFDYSLWGCLLISVAVVAFYPLLNMFSQSSQQRAVVPPAPPTGEECFKERDKVLSLLEEGKITPEESAELLNALNISSNNPSFSRPKTNNLLVVGGALILIGFFLPWFTYDLGKEMANMTSQMKQEMSRMGVNVPMNLNVPNANVTSRYVVSGADGGGQALGILLLGLGAAMAPFFAFNIDRASRRTITLICLAAGSAILLYLLSSSMRFASFGFFIVLAGYACEWIGLLRDWQEEQEA